MWRLVVLSCGGEVDLHPPSCSGCDCQWQSHWLTQHVWTYKHAVIESSGPMLVLTRVTPNRHGVNSSGRFTAHSLSEIQKIDFLPSLSVYRPGYGSFVFWHSRFSFACSLFLLLLFLLLLFLLFTIDFIINLLLLLSCYVCWCSIHRSSYVSTNSNRLATKHLLLFMMINSQIILLLIHIK